MILIEERAEENISLNAEEVIVGEGKHGQRAVAVDTLQIPGE